MSTTNNEYEAYYDAAAATQHKDQTLPVLFLCLMLLLALVLLLGRALQNRPKLNAYLSEPALILLVSACCSFGIKVMFGGGGSGSSSNSNSASSNDDAYVSDNNNNNNDNDGYYDYDNDNGNNNNNNNNSYAVMNTINENQLFSLLLTFSGELFFMVFLPPIMFNSGYQLKRELFFRHLKPIVSFAVIGTATAGLITGAVLWCVSRLGWLSSSGSSNSQLNFTVFELLTFGALITATDTVSVLGVLNAKRVNPHLFSLVFGESALNDAVAIVLFESFSHLVELSDSASNYQMEDTSSMLKEIGTFVGTFVVDIVGCPIMGIVFASLSALVFKYITFDGTPILELTLYMLIMYIPFIVAEILGMSGIVTIFFTGIFARRYVEPNVTDATKHNAEVIFNLVAYLAETCIFINLGLSVFGFSGQFHWSFISCAFIASLIGRAMAIYPISFLNNMSLREYMNRPFSCTGRSGGSTAVNRRATIDVATAQTIATLNNNDDSNNNDNTNSFMMMQSSIAMAAPQSNRVGEAAFASNGDANNNSSTRSSVTKDGYSIEPMDVDEYSINSIGMIVLRTPEQSRDKIIPVKFMHFLWFAGLRGAVAYACARDFPNTYGNREVVIAATMVIVFVSVIGMGAFCEPLLNILNIRMDVDDEEYMKEWRNRRSLDGPIHQLEKTYIYDTVVRETTVYDEDMDDDEDDDINIMNNDRKSMESFHLTERTGKPSLRRKSVISECRERAATASVVSRTLTGSIVYV